MRKHQIAKETSDIPLSILIKENQSKAMRDMQKTHGKHSNMETENDKN